MKNCTKCGINKLMTDFSKRTVSKDGLRSWCKDCERISQYNNCPRCSNKKTKTSTYCRSCNYVLNREEIKEGLDIEYIPHLGCGRYSA